MENNMGIKGKLGCTGATFPQSDDKGDLQRSAEKEGWRTKSSRGRQIPSSGVTRTHRRPATTTNSINFGLILDLLRLEVLGVRV